MSCLDGTCRAAPLPLAALPLTRAVRTTLVPTGTGVPELVGVVVVAVGAGALMICVSGVLAEARFAASPL